MALIPKYMVRAHKPFFAMCLFLAVFGAIHATQPALLYADDGSFRTFGVGYRQKTVVPIWLVAIFLAISSYVAVLAYLLFA
jgi:hypothetical protein